MRHQGRGPQLTDVIQLFPTPRYLLAETMHLAQGKTETLAELAHSATCLLIDDSHFRNSIVAQSWTWIWGVFARFSSHETFSPFAPPSLLNQMKNDTRHYAAEPSHGVKNGVEGTDGNSDRRADQILPWHVSKMGGWVSLEATRFATGRITGAREVLHSIWKE